MFIVCGSAGSNAARTGKMSRSGRNRAENLKSGHSFGSKQRSGSPAMRLRSFLSSSVASSKLVNGFGGQYFGISKEGIRGRILRQEIEPLNGNLCSADVHLGASAVESRHCDPLILG